MAAEPSVEKVAADLRALMVPGRGACGDGLRACTALTGIADNYRQRRDETRGDTIGTTRKLLIDFVALRGNDTEVPDTGKKQLTEANEIAIVSRAIRLYDSLPEAITKRREAATAGTKVSVGVFKSAGRKPENTIGHYCLTFAKSFLDYVDNLTAEPGKHIAHSDTEVVEPAVTGSQAWARLQAMSQRLAAEIDRSAEADKQGALRLSQGSYVEREVEGAIVRRLRTRSNTSLEIVVGEAGDGKTTLLWSLHRQLSQDSMPILLSAVWFQPDEHGNQVLSTDDVVEAVAEGNAVVVLLDTADLLLHSAVSVEQTIGLIDRLSSSGVPIVVATRPRESLTLPIEYERRTVLGPYSDTELAAAVPQLVASYCPGDAEAPADPTTAIKLARARGLLVERVCASPLLLRLMFELAGPKFPRLEVDVTGLYRQYWQRRVVTDRRTHSHGPAPTRQADLSTAAGLVGIAMVASGRPEILLDVAVRRCAEIASNAGLRLDAEKIRDAIDTLCERGVLNETGGSIRFLHQTLFEFAAAQGLAQRGSDRELHRLIARLEASPDDLFLGAVVEQLLIVLADDNLSKEAVTAAVRRLSRTRMPSLVEIAMLVWAHHPDLLGVTPEDVDTADVHAVARFIRVVPSVHSSADDIIEHLEWIWNKHKGMRPKVVDACAYLVRRTPTPVVKFVAAVDIFADLANNQLEMVRANVTPLVLLDAVLATSPSYARSAVLNLMEKLTARTAGRSAIETCLRLIAGQWKAVGSPEFLTDIENLIEAMQRQSGDSEAKAVREALSEVIAAHWSWTMEPLPLEDRPTTWMTLVQALCTALEDIPIRTRGTGNKDARAIAETVPRGDQSPVLGARLIAVARIVATMTGEDPQIDATLDQLFGLTGPGATRQLARGSIAFLLMNDCPATDSVIRRLSQCLEACLPADYNAFETGPELWAAVARSCLMDSRIHADRIVAVTAQAQQRHLDPTSLWTRRDMLLGLAPAAIVASDQDATDVFTKVGGGRLSLPDVESHIFLDNAVDRISQAPNKLAPLMIDIAQNISRPAVVRELTAVDTAQPVLKKYANQMDLWIAQLLSGTDKHQGEGASLLLALIRIGTLAPSLDWLIVCYHRLNHPEAKADVIRAIGCVTLKTDRNQDAIAFLRTIIRATRHPTPVINAIVTSEPSPKLARPVVLDAARDALLEAFGFQAQPSPADLDIVFALTFAPRVSGTKAVEMTGVGNLSLYLTHLADAGYVGEASQCLSDVVDTLAPIKGARGRLASNRLRVAVGSIVKKASSNDLEALLSKVEIAPPKLSGLLIRAAVRERYRDARATIDRLATHPTLGPEVNKALNSRIRVIGQQTFPEVLSAAH